MQNIRHWYKNKSVTYRYYMSNKYFNLLENVSLLYIFIYIFALKFIYADI